MNFCLTESEIRGMTLVELLAVVVIVAVVMLSLVPFMSTGRQAWEIVGDRHAEVLQNSRIGLDKMTREIRQAQSVTYAGSDYIEFVDRDNNDVRFEYDDATSEYLEYGAPGDLNPLSGPINSLSMVYYEEDGITTTTTPEDIRSVQIQMTTFDSEGKVIDIALSSRVFIRKEPVVTPIVNLFLYSVADLQIHGNSTVTGDISSSDGIQLQDYSVVDGNAMVEHSSDITIEGDAALNGDIIVSSVRFPAASSFSDGSTNVAVTNSEHTTLPPGAYGNLSVTKHGILTLESGDYFFKMIDITDDAIIDFPGSGNVRIFVTSHINIYEDSRIAIDGSVVDVESETAIEKAREVFAETQDKLEIKGTSQWIGTVFASSTITSKESKLYGSVKFTGALYSGHRINIMDATAIFVTPNIDILPSQFL